MPDYSDIVIIGAGAAGIAAARTLVSAGQTVRVLEARSRAGGRAFTRLADGRVLDMGCGWLHSADVNPLLPLARDAGFHIDESLAPWQRQPDARFFPHERHSAFRATQQDFDTRLVEAAQAGADCAASTLLEAGNIWNPLLGAISTYVNGVELDQLSVHDATSYHDSDIHFRVTEGLGTFLTAAGAQAPITDDCPVRCIDHSGRVIQVETTRGTLRCATVIVTVPTNVLASGVLRFTPDVPEHRAAAGHLPLGIANKIFLAVDGYEDLPESQFLIAHHDRIASGSYHVRPFGWPIIEGYFGGAFARDLESGGPQAFAEQAISELCGVLGNHWRKRFSLITASAWASDQFSQGSYSHALPGHAGARAILATPHENRIFFAGEATSRNSFSTVHGAWESGLRAAQDILDGAGHVS